jgi:YtkA-like
VNLRMKTGIGVATLALLAMAGCNRSSTDLKELESHRWNDTVVTLLSDKGDLTQGQNHFAVLFRSASTGKPVDAGHVYVASSMLMPGMSPMSAGIELQPAGERGQYLAKGDFGMSGAWHFEIRWDGPAGRGDLSFSRNVR